MELALAEFLPIPAHFGLVLHLIILHKGISFDLIVEVPLGPLDGCFLVDLSVHIIEELSLLFVGLFLLLLLVIELFVPILI